MNQSAQAILSIDKIDLKYFGRSLVFLNNNNSKIGKAIVRYFSFQKLFLSTYIEQFIFQLTTHQETLLALSAFTSTKQERNILCKVYKDIY